jgi:hypothetical protein
MPAMLFVLLLLLSFLLLAAGASWGPPTHIWSAIQTIKRLQRKRRVSAIEHGILQHPDAFCYGTIAADIISFKNFGGLKNHCHNWNMRDRMAPLLTTPETKAFGMGYLCHLAADVSSHNHFIPYHVVAELPPRLRGHVYWESKADALVGEKYFEKLDSVRRNEAFRAFDEIIDEAVAVKALSLRSNRLIFHAVVLGQSQPVWRMARELLGRRPQALQVHRDLLEILKLRILHAMTRVIDGRDWATIMIHDPSGRVALRAARALRRQLLDQYARREVALPVARRLARDCFWPPEE